MTNWKEVAAELTEHARMMRRCDTPGVHAAIRLCDLAAKLPAGEAERRFASGEVVYPKPKNFGYPPNEPCTSATPGCCGTYAFTRLGERCSQCTVAPFSATLEGGWGGGSPASKSSLTHAQAHEVSFGAIACGRQTARGGP